MILQKRFRNCVLTLAAGISLITMAAAQAGPTPGTASLGGTVYDSQHRPIADAEVFLQATSDVGVLKTRTDSAGSYRFSALAPGTYTLRAETASHKKVAAPVTLTEKEEHTADLTISANNQTSNLAFSDAPTFTVAGVTDTTSLGGHGSETVVRGKNALAKATVSLSKETAGTSAPSASSEEADRHHGQGEIAEKAGDPLTAVREYQRAAELDASERNIFDWGAELLLHHAPEPAAEVFTNGHRLFPKSLRMQIGLAVALYVHGAYEEAAQRLCDAADNDPNNPVPYLFLGKILGIETRISPAVAQRLARFVALKPDNAMANYYSAVSLWKQRSERDIDATAVKVQSLLEKSLTLDSKLAVASLELGIVHAERRQIPEAIAAYQHAIQVDPSLEQAHYRLAQAYRINGQGEKAQIELKTYQELSKATAAESERERTEIKQFVYTLRKEN